MHEPNSIHCIKQPSLDVGYYDMNMCKDVLTPNTGLELFKGDCWFIQGELLAVLPSLWDTSGLDTGETLDRCKAF